MKIIKNYICLISILFLWNGYCQQTKLKIGDRIPEFELYDQYARTFNSLDHIGKQPLVIFFYPEDESKLCTKQFIIVKNSMESFKKYNAVVVGINSESIVNHKRFVINNELPFFLLFDRNNEVQELFGVPYLKAKKPKRYTFVIDKNGIIIDVFYNKKDVQYHVNQALISLSNITKNEKH